MDTREERRTQLLPGIARLARSRDFRTSFARLTSATHAMTIIVALPDDNVGYVFDRLQEGGGAGVLAMQDRRQAWQLAVMWPASAARREVAREDDSLVPVHRSSRVDMFFAYLHEARSVVVVQCVAAQLVDQDEFQLT